MDEAQPPGGAQWAAVAAHLRRAARASEAPWLHREVGARMAARLEMIRRSPQRVVEWWPALGGSAALHERCRGARFERYEDDAELAARADPAARWWSPQRWRRAPAREAGRPPDEGAADLVWANMMLHWDAEPLTTMRRWHAALAAGGFVMFSCFGPDTLRELRALYRRLGWGAPAHAYIDMHDLGDAMLRAGFAEPVTDMERLTLTWADAAALLAELRTLGGNAAAGRCPGLRTPRWRAALCREIAAALAGPDGRPALSFEIVYGHAFKPAPRVDSPGRESRVSVEELRRTARARRPS